MSTRPLSHRAHHTHRGQHGRDAVGIDGQHLWPAKCNTQICVLAPRRKACRSMGVEPPGDRQGGARWLRASRAIEFDGWACQTHLHSSRSRHGDTTHELRRTRDTKQSAELWIALRKDKNVKGESGDGTSHSRTARRQARGVITIEAPCCCRVLRCRPSP